MTLSGKISKMRQIYRENGIVGTLKAVAAYIRWLLEFVIFARVTNAYIRLQGGVVEADGLIFDVWNGPIQRETRHRILRGTYEESEVSLIKSYVNADTDVIELGGGIGYVSCHLNRQIEPNRNHVVVEANEDLLPVLQRNKEQNECSYYIVHAAYAPGKNFVAFNTSATFESGNVSESDNGQTVPTTSIGELADEIGTEEYTLVADIEGSERQFIENELAELQQRCEMMIFEWHYSTDELKEFLETLSESGFEPQEQRGNVVVLQRIM